MRTQFNPVGGCKMKPLFPFLIVTAVICPFAPTSDGLAQDVPVPQYRVDPFWPRVAYPNGWLQPGEAEIRSAVSRQQEGICA